ncbi:ribonuclease H-like domain-containing protein [Tanacetum coccineum]
MNRRALLRCDSTEDLYPIMQPSTIPYDFLISQYTWHQCVRHPGSEVLRRILSSNSISCTKEKPLVLYHACQLDKHMRLPFITSNMLVKSCFDVVHSDLWTSPILSLSGYKYYCEIKSFQCDHGGEFDNHAFHKLFADNGIDEVFLALRWHLEEIHVTWAHLEKKRTRLRLYTKNHKELCIQSVETAWPL